MNGHLLLAGALAAIGAFPTATIAVPHIDYTAILPELILIGGALIVLVSGQLVFARVPVAFYSAASGAIGVAALVASIVLVHDVSHSGPFTTIDRSVAMDGFSATFLVLVSCIVVLGAAFADGYLRREQIHGPEYHVLALLAGSGAMLMATANDLVLIFVALEIMSIPLYILAGLDQRRRESGEAAMKYFVLGAFSSAIFVYGIALVYGATGSTNLAQIAYYLAKNTVSSNGVLLAGMALLLVGFGFKVAAVPFHMWTPDVYQGAPTPATGYMAALAKAGGFAALIRVFFSTFSTLRADWQPVLFVIAAATLVVGAVLGLVQRDVKRMLAYSSINHAGFVLIGLQAATRSGVAGSVYYVFAYAIIVLGSFAVVTVVGRDGDGEHDLDSYRGLGRRAPLLALGFTVLLLAQTGVPLTTGFLSKLLVVNASVAAHSYSLAVIAMLSGAVAAAFYLRVVFLMYGMGLPAGTGADAGSVSLDLGLDEGATGSVAGDEGADDHPPQGPPRTLGPVKVPLVTAVALGAVVGVTVIFGIWPAPLVNLAHGATLLF